MQWASRQRALTAIQAGRIAVNEEAQTKPNAFLKLDRDIISVDGQVLQRKHAKPITIVFHKPAGVAGSREEGRKTLYSHLSNKVGWYMPGGSLHKAASGIVIVTNDPTHRNAEQSNVADLTKDLLIKVHRQPKKTELTKLTKQLREQWPQAGEELEVSMHAKGARHAWIKVTYRRGKTADLMRVLKEAKLEPLRVIRSRVGPFSVDNVASGAWYRLSDPEVVALDELAKDRPTKDDVSLQAIWDKIAVRFFGSQS